jgi:ABC-2 type transport system ATP-binding protein
VKNQTNVLEVHQLTKVFGGKKPTFAVNGLSFTVKEGEIVGLLGPNGAGKTTTIQILLGTMSKTSGSIVYFSQDFDHNRSDVLQRMNYASAYTKLPWHLTVEENLTVYAMLYGVKNPRPRIEKLLKQFGMYDYIKKPINSLSAGQTTRVILAKAFINYPEIILLDEPTASLDPDSAAQVRQFLLKQQREYNVAMLFTSHNMAEVSEVCDRVLFIQKGNIVAEDTPTGLAKRIRKVKIRLLVAGEEMVLECEEDEIAKELQRLASQGVTYTQISIDKPTLEDYFIQAAREEA